ncbi:pyridoxal-phosphate dependent enzyme [Brachyspira hyodysenteriae]|nr:pyridoxal-phosphate dependent enzyme [Brachyspira hyodysenteriae]
MLEAYKMLTTEEGVFAEPASAASLAGIIKSRKAGKINKGDTVVSVLTGNGLKDPDNAIKICNEPIKVDNNIEEIRKAIGI